MKHQKNLLIGFGLRRLRVPVVHGGNCQRNAMYDTSSSAYAFVDNLNSYQPDTLLGLRSIIQQENQRLFTIIFVRPREQGLLQSADIIGMTQQQYDHRDQGRAIFEAQSNRCRHAYGTSSEQHWSGRFLRLS